MLVVLLIVARKIILDPLVMYCLFWVLLPIPCIPFPLLLYAFELEYCALLVDIVWLYQYMLVAFLCLFFCKLSILCLYGSLLHRSCYPCLGMTAILQIHYAHWSMFLVSPSVCLWLSWAILSVFSESASIASSCVYLVVIDVFLWELFDNRVDCRLFPIFPLQSWFHLLY